MPLKTQPFGSWFFTWEHPDAYVLKEFWCECSISKWRWRNEMAKGDMLHYGVSCIIQEEIVSRLSIDLWDHFGRDSDDHYNVKLDI